MFDLKLNLNLNTNYPLRRLKPKLRYRVIIKKHLATSILCAVYSSVFFKNLFIFKLQSLCMRKGFKLKISKLIFQSLFFLKKYQLKKPFII